MPTCDPFNRISPHPCVSSTVFTPDIFVSRRDNEIHLVRATKQAIAEEGEGEEAVERMKPSGIGRVLNRGQPLVCGHCTGQTEGARNELRGVDVSPQGVSDVAAAALS